MKGDLQYKGEKNGKKLTRKLNPDREYISPDGNKIKLHGRALMLNRNVGHLMTNPSILLSDGSEIPEGIMEAFITTAAAIHDFKSKGNSRTNSVYIVKPKMHGSDEAAFADLIFEKVENVLGFEIILENIPESRKKIRETKPQFIVSDYQKVVRDFAFLIDEKYSSGEIISLVKKIDKELIKNVKIFDVYQGENIGDGKKSIAFNVILEPKDKTLSDNDIDQISKKIISTVQESTGATLRS